MGAENNVDSQKQWRMVDIRNYVGRLANPNVKKIFN